MTEKLNKKKRRPTEPNGSKANISEYTSSYSTQDIHTTEDSVNSEGDNEVLLPARSSGYMTMSQEAKTLAETSNQPNIKSAEDRNDKEGVNPATSEISDEKEVSFFIDTSVFALALVAYSLILAVKFPPGLSS